MVGTCHLRPLAPRRPAKGHRPGGPHNLFKAIQRFQDDVIFLLWLCPAAGRAVCSSGAAACARMDGPRRTPRGRKESVFVTTIKGFLRNSSRRSSSLKRGSVSPLVSQDVLDREMYSNLWKQRRLLPPTKRRAARFRKKWFRLLLVLAFYEFVAIPLQLSFQVPRASPAVPGGAAGRFELPWTQVVLQWLIDCCFAFDMYLEFRTMLVGPADQARRLALPTAESPCREPDAAHRSDRRPAPLRPRRARCW